MVASRDGLSMSTSTLRWFNILIALAAFIGPPASYMIATRVNEERTEGRLRQHEDRMTRTEKDVDEMKKSLQDKYDRIDAKLDNIGTRVNEVKNDVSKLQGSIREHGMGNSGSDTLAGWMP